MRRNGKAKAAVAVASIIALTTGCTSLPANTDPHVLHPFDEQTAGGPDVTPVQGREPDLLLRDFYSAAAVPAGDYEAARAFLTGDARSAWDPRVQTLVVDSLGVTTLVGGAGNKRSFSVHGDVVGELHDGGAFTPEHGSYEATIELELVDGEWRISSLPSGVVLERSEMRDEYQPYDLYFFDPAGNELITDRRWVFAHRESLPSALISLLTQGPSDRLQPAVSGPNTLASAEEEGATIAYTGFNDGAYDFTGFGGMDEQTRKQFAAQVVWTLASAGVTGPYNLQADGEALFDGADKLTVDDFAEFSPLVDLVGDSTLYSLTDGHVSRVSGGTASQVDGPLGQGGNVMTADIYGEDAWAGVFGDGPEGEDDTFRVGRFGGGDEEVVKGKTFSRPTFEPNAAAVWIVAEGKNVLRTWQSTATGEYTTSEITVDLPEGVEGNISVLRLSRSSARVLMIIDGHLYTGIVQRGQTGDRSIVNVMEYASELGGSFITAEWQPDGSLLAGTSSAAAPVLRVEQDGFSTATLSAGNISAPVVAVGTSPNMLYVTDANALLQMPISGADNPLWREVPGLLGTRALPIVARH
ncbi:hypothetical protein FPH17_10030 [Corynebacterium godavarianum]|uniref:Lipoprotein LpqB n=1 Tax=Corynebacterium godavarianum TaxID=2054421 RepID=A0ABY3DYS5_9CORY|nr:LpqB family beta-propeller domain-containing protein [Corynebacterium godavarianum]MBL7285319.1 hypothetical protein [Corynebacterium godavarianum]TSJ71867.1 hypothetical protein FPH17_10030 [Corynebacterium godavarianum]